MSNSLHEHIVTYIREYPTLFECRTDVLDHLFCVNGNGLTWREGILVPNLPETVRPFSKHLESEEADLAHAVDAAHAAAIRIRVRRWNMELTFRYENAEDLAQVRWDDTLSLVGRERPRAIYPLCSYASMAEVPDDVQPDWLAGLREMIFVVFAAPDRVRPHHGRIEAEAPVLQQQENIRIADIVLRDLARRFGDGGLPTNFSEWSERRRATQQQLHRLLENRHG